MPRKLPEGWNWFQCQVTDEEKANLELYCQQTRRNKTEVTREWLRSLPTAAPAKPDPLEEFLKRSGYRYWALDRQPSPHTEPFYDLYIEGEFSGAGTKERLLTSLQQKFATAATAKQQLPEGWQYSNNDIGEIWSGEYRNWFVKVYRASTNPWIQIYIGGRLLQHMGTKDPNTAIAVAQRFIDEQWAEAEQELPPGWTPTGTLDTYIGYYKNFRVILWDEREELQRFDCFVDGKFHDYIYAEDPLEAIVKAQSLIDRMQEQTEGA